MLLPNEDLCAAIRIDNLTSQPYTLAAGAEVGQASMAQVLNILSDSVSDSQPSDCRDSVPDISCDVEDYSHLQPVIDRLPEELSVEEYDEAVRFIHEYSHVFSRSEFDLGRTSQITHRFNTGDARPIRQGLRQHPQIYMDVIDCEVAAD